MRFAKGLSVRLLRTHYQIRLASTACERTAGINRQGYARPAGVDWRYRSHFTRRRAHGQRLSGLTETRPAIGTVLNQGDYDNFKKSLTSVSLRKGYFDSEFIKSQLGIALGAIRRFGILIMIAVSAIASDLSPSKVRRFVMNIYKICCRLKRVMSTNRKIWRN
ncbi:outer membrane protein, OMP85 family [Salmonella enterica subsp. enterica]|nr:outer membrane protein, OMP85 family [Salmonella enterica subsp. enterica]